MTSTATTARPASPGSPLRGSVWLLHLALPLLGLWLLLAVPAADVHWEHHVSHALLVGLTAAASLVVALAVRRAARRHADARLTLVGLAFVTAAVFLLLHAVTTPQVLVTPRTLGFVVSTETGLALAAVFLAWASVDFTPPVARRVLRAEPWLLAAVLLAAVAWGATSFVPSLPTGALVEPTSGSELWWLSALGVALYVVACLRFWALYRRRRSVVLVAVVTASALLAEALVAVVLSRTWALSWWLWHVLMLLGFAFVAYSARVQYRREGSAHALFTGIGLAETLRDVQVEHRRALTELVDAIEEMDGAGQVDAHPAAVRVGQRFELTEAQVAVLEEAASATHEVDRLRRQVEQLFSQYLSPEVASSLIADPSRAELGGATREVTVLFADLRGFTPFAENTAPDEVVRVLNAYFSGAVPAVLDRRGTVVQFVGDALMAVFNAPEPLEDHALAAAGAALALQRHAEALAAGHPDWPRFRVGVNTGPALVGNVGGSVRTWSAIGDATNLAARLEAAAEPGQVVLGPSTRAALGDRADVRPLGALELKGKSAPVEAFALLSLREDVPAQRKGSDVMEEHR